MRLSELHVEANSVSCSRLPGCGKTTAARQFETESAALRLTKDEWMKALYGADNPESASDAIEGRLIKIALRTLTLGVNVTFDFGLWSRDERSALRLHPLPDRTSNRSIAPRQVRPSDLERTGRQDDLGASAARSFTGYDEARGAAVTSIVPGSRQSALRWSCQAVSMASSMAARSPSSRSATTIMCLAKRRGTPNVSGF
jgi:hypothetical protein